MVPPDSDRIPRGRPYSGTYLAKVLFRIRGSHSVSPGFPSRSAKVPFALLTGPTTPKINLRFRLFPFRSPLLRESLLDFFSSAYLDVSVRQVLLLLLYVFKQKMIRISLIGFPHSDISGSLLLCKLPEAFRILTSFFAFLMPRHPSAALNSLIF